MRCTNLLLALSLIVCVTLPAAAQSPPPIDAQHFQPHADHTGFFTTYSSQTLQLWQPAFGLWLSYARDPVVYYYADSDDEDRVLGDLMTMDLQAAIGFGPADIAIDMPLHLMVGGDGLSGWGGAISGTAAGDLRVIPKVRFLDADKRGIGLGLVLPLSFPTGDETRFAGASTVTFTPMLAVTGHIGIFRLGGNLGAHVARGEDVGDLRAGSAFVYRAAAGITPHPVIDINLEFYGRAGQRETRANPTEWLVGATVHPHESLGITLAGGSATGPGLTAPEGRIVFGIGWAPVASKDTDGDGLKDRVDECPEDPEDFDDFDDDDGCPDLDNDGDGILDADDVCPMDPETFNNWVDDDGCPDEVPDTDGDGIRDDTDQCVDDPEDIDGFEDTDGCPDPDNDGDGILDVDDKCIDQPEVYNNVEDEDGCPDKGRVKLADGEIQILEKVYFDLNKATIKNVSQPLLDDVAGVLTRFDNIRKVEVQGHTDKQGSDSYNQRLSQARAEAVVAYLVGKGIDAGRLEAKGYGESQLIDESDTDEAHQANRRVQFVILEKN